MSKPAGSLMHNIQHIIFEIRIWGYFAYIILSTLLRNYLNFAFIKLQNIQTKTFGKASLRKINVQV